MKAKISIISEENERMGIEAGDESTLYFRLEEVKTVFKYTDIMVTNIGGIEYSLVYDYALYKEIIVHLENE